MAGLIEVKELLRRRPRNERRSLRLDVADLASAYRQQLDSAPQRRQGYLSNTRTGAVVGKEPSNRTEERLAVRLFNRRELPYEDGSGLRLIDYQFPLKSVRADIGLGKVDLLGVSDDAQLVIIELKALGNGEDRRIGLIEGLIYAAVVEANISAIADEIAARKKLQIARLRPRIMLVGPPKFWSDRAGIPSIDELLAFTAEIRRTIPISIELLNLNDPEVADEETNDRQPQPYLTSVAVGVTPQGIAVDGSHYLQELFRTFWSFCRKTHDSRLFDRAGGEAQPPVFQPAHAHLNILLPPGAPPDVYLCGVGIAHLAAYEARKR